MALRRNDLVMYQGFPAPHFDEGKALLDRRVFADAAVLRRELATVFDRAWLFVAPSAWLAQPGDFVTTRMGDEPVLAWRGADHRLALFTNRCSHSGSALTDQPRGRALALHCPCHGWAYSGAHDAATQARPEGIAQMAEYRGLVFGNRDSLAPSFANWLGDFAWYLDMFLLPTGSAYVGEESMRWSISANWKLPVLSGCGEPPTNPDAQPPGGKQIAVDPGTVTVVDGEGPAGDDPRKSWIPLRATLFPNLVLDCERHALEIVHPLGATQCEMHSYCLTGAGVSESQRNAARQRFQFRSGPAGGESANLARQWETVTATARAGRHRQANLNLSMGLGQEGRTNLPGSFAPLVSEANQRAFFAWWQGELEQPARERRRWLHF